MTATHTDAAGGPGLVGEAGTLPRLFLDTVRRRPDAVAIRTPDGDLTWAGYAQRAGRVAGALAGLGIGRGDRILLMLRNRVEFHLVDTAAMLLGAVPVSVYNSSSVEQIGYLGGHCGATAAVVDEPFVDRVRAARTVLPELRHLITLGAPGPDIAFTSLLDGPELDLEAAAARARPDDLLTLIYTSGTTGPPKGVMLTHDNVRAVLAGMTEALGQDLAGWELLSFLPMAHVAERNATHYLHLTHGTVITPCPDLAGLDNGLRRVRPQFFFAPPRIWEKLRERIERDRPPDPLAEVGLDRCRVAVTGAAPAPAALLGYFGALGLPVSECYGLSECTGVMTWSPRRPQPGRVGTPLAGQRVRLLPDGEIVCRGPNVFPGYYGEPGRTARVRDDDGWLHTGDLGIFDGHGALRITGRKKDLIITSGGKNISPSGIEAALLEQPEVDQACVFGNNRAYLVALLVAAPGVDEQALRRAVREVNRTVSRPEQIKRFAVLPGPWSPESGELTPTLKPRRRVIEECNAVLIDGLYDAPTHTSGGTDHG